MLSVMGLDPGLAKTGIAVVRGLGSEINSYAFGCIETSPVLCLAKRLEKIYAQTIDFLEEVKPDLIIVEDVFSLPRYPRSGILLGKVTGVLLVAASLSGIPVKELAVKEAKKVLTGNGAASKQQLERAVRHILGHKKHIRPDHASDALALALIGLYRFSDP